MLRKYIKSMFKKAIFYIQNTLLKYERELNKTVQTTIREELERLKI